jgi:hypothetical protein
MFDRKPSKTTIGAEMQQKIKICQRLRLFGLVKLYEGHLQHLKETHQSKQLTRHYYD